MSSMKMNKNTDAFLALLRAGLWEKEVSLSQYGGIDFAEAYRLAEEQSVVGLVAAGVEHVTNVRVPQQEVLTFVGNALRLERRNLDMNDFLSDLIERLRRVGVYTLLVKGQGIAQCYERPLWRASGDIDLFLSADNYVKTKNYLLPLGVATQPEEKDKRHFAMSIGQWAVELHGTLHGGLSARVDRVLDEVMNDVFYGGDVRSWMNGKTQVFLPGVNCDVIYVFSHLLQHFFKGGIGLRQICDWCRFLWVYRDSIDKKLLEQRLRKMRIMSEWHAFGAFAVEYLGMPVDAMPLYSDKCCWKRKARKVCRFVIKVGNFGHNRDMSYYGKKTYLVRKSITAWRRIKDLFRHIGIFPIDSIRFFWGIMYYGLVSTLKGE